MTQFLGTHQNKLDAKGRVSVPAPFRAALKGRPRANGAADPAAVAQASCIEGWPAAVRGARRR